MANTLTGLVPVLYSAADIVARELTGMITAVRRDFDDKKAGKDQTIRVPKVPVQAGADFTPGDTYDIGGACAVSGR